MAKLAVQVPADVDKMRVRQFAPKAGVTETAPPIDVDKPNRACSLATRRPRGALTSLRGSNALLLAVLATDHKPGEWSAIGGAATPARGRRCPGRPR